MIYKLLRLLCMVIVLQKIKATLLSWILKAVKYTIDSIVIDSNRLFALKDTVNKQKNTAKLDLILVFYSQFFLTRVNFMQSNLKRPIIRVNFMLSFFFKKRVDFMRAYSMNFQFPDSLISCNKVISNIEVLRQILIPYICVRYTGD